MRCVVMVDVWRVPVKGSKFEDHIVQASIARSMKVFSPSPPMADAARDFNGPAEIVFTRMPYLGLKARAINMHGFFGESVNNNEVSKLQHAIASQDTFGQPWMQVRRGTLKLWGNVRRC